jgi:hypothetical protein
MVSPLGNRRRIGYAGGSLAVVRSPNVTEVKKMARKVLNRKELRAENDAAEKVETKKKKTPKKKAKRKSRAKTVKEVRLKAFWGVFNQSLRREATFEYSERKEADAKAEKMTASKKSPHFVQLVKEVIEE